ncbi:hypothetical protein MYCTH_97762 [Thermothelomyces thermophilus ATCC 42464]|uniref:Major facilitator superfamily (MFS) profile domain-containing protein n=1 Tax=Thermothelomyces thermophilus (strain ATCC 42464 / BCRC 31852 / DSM 1799) TaxID=573729 RepID=G2Q3C9_THET4|nr:uncharacterized protein MYCTH_97762 [Thermothelomyces thermophilus ATCC 42464]AEO55189.1 hypothetical protein MYCTH_97762 [Thermothelomyces thermophilus ATCC 42464]
MAPANDESDSSTPTRSPPLEAMDKINGLKKHEKHTSEGFSSPSEDNPTGVPAVDGTDENHLIPQTLSGLRLMALSIGVALGLFLSMLDTSIVATSLFAIAAEFGEDSGGGDGDVGALNWVALAYELSYLGCAVLCARMSDVVGRRAAFAAAYVVFVASSLACGFARSMDQLVAFRAVQGLGGSACR